MVAEKVWLGFFGVLCMVLASSEGRAETRDWRVSASANYETGEYGTSTRTETLYMPVTLKRYFLEGDASVTIPYISQTSSSEVVTIDGSVFQIKRSPGPAVTNSGLGDVVLKGSYYLLAEGKKWPFDLNLSAKIKMPTASDSKGLGTGEFDTGLGLEFAKALPSGFTGYFDIYYTAIGDPPGLDLEDRVSFDAGFSRTLDARWTLSAFYEESTPLVRDNANLRDFLVSFEYKTDERTKIFFGSTLGLTNTSPDYGFTVGASFLL